jgi:hypothetical protein
MTRVVINPGICGFTTAVEVTKEAKRMVSIGITSDCEQIAGLSKSLKELNIWDVLNQGADCEVHRQATRHRLHSVCPVPIGILKAIEVEAGLALPRDVIIHFETPEHG